MAKPLERRAGMLRRLSGVRGGGTALALVIGVALVLANISPVPDASAPTRREAPATRLSAVDTGQSGVPDVRFTDVTAASGITFVHENGAAGEKLLPETMGGGCAFLDFDGDGDQDVLFVNSKAWPGDTVQDAASHATPGLYRNDGRGHFDDVTAGSGLDVTLYGMGVAVGDYDNDGLVDLFISALGPNRLFKNLGGGKFADVSRAAGVAGDPAEWSTSCGWFDYDNDGDLDLLVCNYVKWSREVDLAQDFRLPDGRRAYGRPQDFAGAFPYLYRNEGGGRFADVSADSGIQIRDKDGAAVAKSLGITFNDFDGDGWLDVVIANDTTPNQFLRNRGNGTFEELGALVGIAFDAAGNVRGAMGIDSAAFRDDAAVGVTIGNFANEMTALYVSDGDRVQFSDEAIPAGLGHATHRSLTFGLCYVDYDLDGRLDIFAANGHLEPEINSVQPAQSYEQSPQLFWNSGRRRGEFIPVPVDKVGADFARPMVGRGASFADIDADGDLDLLVTATGQPPRLLRNDQRLGHHWLRLKLIGTKSNRSAIGAVVEVHLPDRTLRRHVMSTRSYLSQVELPLTIGLGKQDRVDSVTIHWPDGSRQTLGSLQVDQEHEIQQPAESVNSTSPAGRPGIRKQASAGEIPQQSINT